MQNQVITDPLALHELLEPWRAIAGGHPFHSPDWLSTWWKHYGEGHQLAVFTTRDAIGNPRAIAPFYMESSSFRTRIRFLGSGNVCTDYQAIALSHEYGDLALEELVRSIDKTTQSFSKWSGCQLELDGVSPDATWYPQFCQQMQRCGYTLREQPIESTYVVQLPDTWAEYLATLSKGFRRKPKKCMTRFESEGITFHLANDLETVLNKLPVLCQLHQKRRQMLGQPGSFADQKFLPFLLDVARRFAPRQQMEMQWCQQGDHIICMHLLFIHDQTASMYVSGIEPELLSIEPGHLLITGSINNALSRGIKRYDFLRGDEHYKHLWNGQPHRLVRSYFTPARPVSLAFESATTWAEKFKHQVKMTFSATQVQP